MPVRINKARNFKGKAYVAADELDNLVKSLAFPATLATSDTAWNMTFTNLDGTPAPGVSAVDLISIKNYIDNKSVGVIAGNGITIDTTTSGATNPIISTNLKITKVATETGYAASYKLQYQSGANTYTDVTGDTINIVKDQFIKSAAFGWANTTTSTPTDWTVDKAPTGHTDNIHPCIKIEVYVNDNGSSSDDTLADTVYVPLADTFQEYKAGDAIAINTDAQDGKLVISGIVDTANSETVYTAKNTSAAVLTVGADGFKVANIQAAINNAVSAEHLTASAAIEDLEGDVLAFASNTSTAISTLNTRIETVATNAATAAGNAQANAIAYASGVADNAQTAVQKVGSAVDALDSSVSAAIASVNTNVETAIDSAISNVSAAIETTVTSVNTNVGNAVTAVNAMVSGSIDSVNSSVGALKNTVSASISAVNSSVAEFKDTVSATFNTVSTATEGIVADAVTAINTKLTNAVQVVESTVTIADGDYSTGSGIITKTVEAKYILAVYGTSSIEIYPEIQRGDTATDGVYTFTLTADYGASPAAADKDASWNVICVKPLPATGSYDGFATNGYSNTVAYTAGTNSVAYTNAAKATNAEYSSFDATTPNAVDATDVTYTKGSAVAGTTVAKGAAGTAPTSVGNGTEATAPATTGIAVEKAVPAYQNEA